MLVNSNPATIMTDNAMADEIYMEPLDHRDASSASSERSKPDSLLPGLGGQTGLTLAMELAKSGFLEEHNVQLLGTNAETIDKAEDRQLFKDAMAKIGQPCIPSKVVTDRGGRLRGHRRGNRLPRHRPARLHPGRHRRRHRRQRGRAAGDGRRRAWHCSAHHPGAGREVHLRAGRRSSSR